MKLECPKCGASISYNIKKPTTSIEVAGSIILINPERMALPFLCYIINTFTR